MNRLPQSITLRLTMALGVIALAVFSIAGLLQYRALAHELQRASQRELLGKVEGIKHFLTEARQMSDVIGLRHQLDDLLIGHPDLRVWLQSADGTSVFGGPLPQVIDQLNGRHLRVVRQDGVLMDAVDDELEYTAPAPVVRIRVAVDTRPRDQLLASFGTSLVTVCGAGVLLTVLLSALSARRGLAPVKRLSAEASKITPHSMAARLSDVHVDAEVAGLVEAFNGVLDRLEAAYQQVEAFNADVAHELRTPLANLIGGTQIMLSTHSSYGELRDTLGANLEELEQMKVLVNDMLFLARADQGDRAQDLEEVELAAVADSAIRYVHALLEDAAIRCVVEGSAKARCNVSLIRRALVNLLSNAIKFSAQGDTIVLRVSATTSVARFSVFNVGEPIASDVAARMFDRFYRADRARAGTRESNGLGLAIVQAVARMHNGRAFVESGPTGNTVGLDFPVDQR